MYADFYDLKRRPFRPNPTGAEVFVGPQTARIMKSIRSALVGHDAVVAVTGGAGVGKTTLVRRSLDAFGSSIEVLRMPRAQLAHDEVLDYLLEQLQVPNVPAGTIRKVLACRETLARKAQAGHGVCILVEDADRIGEDALVELEALTSADGNDDHGGRLVLLGSEDLRAQLNEPALARLAQRTRLRFRVEPFNAGELLAYLKHCFRMAGADYDGIFSNGTTELLFDLTGGAPRLVNNIVESVLEAAAERGTRQVEPALVAEIARSQHGLDAKVPQAPARTTPPARPAVPTPAPPAPADRADGGESESDTTTAEKLALTDTDSGAFLINDTLPDLEELAPELAARAATNDTGEIPTLFSSARLQSPKPAAHDTARAANTDANRSGVPKAPASEPRQPMAEAQRPSAATTKPAPQPQQTRPAATTPLPPKAAVKPPPPRDASPVGATSNPGPAVRTPPARPAHATHTPPAAPGKAAAPNAAPAPADGRGSTANAAPPATSAPPEDLPAWERDPTLAELRPDLEALELAMAEFADNEPKKKPVAGPEEDPVIELKDPTVSGLPTITLDVAIQEKIREAQDALRKHDATIAEEELEDAPTSAKPAKPAAPATAAANSPKDAAQSDDLRRVAAGIANAKSLEDVDDRMAETLFGEEFSAIAAQVAANAPSLHAEPAGAESGESLELAADDDANADEAETDMEREFKRVYGADALEVSLQGEAPKAGLDLSASQRLATVRALNAERKLSESARLRAKGLRNGNGSPPPPTQTIEEQIDTSMTQTLKTLAARPRPANDDDDDDDDERKGGFFSRFRRH